MTKMKKYLAIFSTICLSIGIVACSSETSENDSAFSSEYSQSWESSFSSSVASESSSFQSSENESDSSGVQEKKDWSAYADFIVEVETGKTPVVLQLTDTQIIDAGQERTADRLGAYHDEYWATDKMEARCYGYLRETIEATCPDLIILTGDLIYGSFDDNGTVWLDFIEFMESFEIPWAPVFGNHDNESVKGVDWQCEQLENTENCLFNRGEVSGNGNYSVGIVQDNELLRVFYMLDTHGCLDSIGLKDDQVAWYTAQATALKAVSPQTNISFALHVQPYVFTDAYKKYGFKGVNTEQNPIFVDYLTYKDSSDFGFLGQDLKTPWDIDYKIWKGMKALGADSIFVGHEHGNSASVVWEGVRFQYGQKSSTYDRTNYVTADGTVITSYQEEGTPMVGGTVIKLSATGEISDSYIYLCEEAGGALDWESWDKYVDDGVNGLRYGRALTASDGVSVRSVEVDKDSLGYGIRAYEVKANQQGKLYLDTSLLKDSTSVEFYYCVSADSTNRMDGNGEFAIFLDGVVEPNIDGTVDGYIRFDSNASVEEVKVEKGKWRRFTIDISEFENKCTEFSFVIPKNNTLFIRDISVAYGASFASWDSGYTSLNFDASIPGGWGSGMFFVAIDSNDTVTLTDRVDWTDKTLADNWKAYGVSFHNTTKALYAGKELTITFTNPKNPAQYLTFKNAPNTNGQVWVTVSYSEGGSVTWSLSFYGNDAGNSYSDRLFSIYLGTNGVKCKWYSTEATLPLSLPFSEAIVTLSSTTGIATTFESIGNARGWQTQSFAVKYYAEGSLVHTESVKSGSAIKYAETPQSAGKLFVGWFETEADAQIADPANQYDITTPVTKALKLYAGFADTVFSTTTEWKSQYLINQEIVLPQGFFSQASETVLAEISVTDSNGGSVVLTNGKFTPTKTGVYTAVYTATVLGTVRTQTKSFTVVETLPFASWNLAGTSIDTNAPVSADSWQSGMFRVTLQAGDTITLRDIVDWSGKSISAEDWIAYQLSFHNGTKAEYAGKEITVKFTDPTDSTRFVTFKNEMNSDGQVWVYASYSKGESRAWSFCKYGSDAGSSYGSRLYSAYLGEDGIKGKFRTSVGSISVTNFFTQAIVSISSSTGISATFTYIGGARNWQNN